MRSINLATLNRVKTQRNRRKVTSCKIKAIISHKKNAAVKSLVTSRTSPNGSHPASKWNKGIK